MAQVEISDEIPELSVLDYEFTEKHAGALGSLLVAAVASGEIDLFAEAIEQARFQLDCDLMIEFDGGEGEGRIERDAARELNERLAYFLVEVAQIKTKMEERKARL